MPEYQKFVRMPEICQNARILPECQKFSRIPEFCQNDIIVLNHSNSYILKFHKLIQKIIYIIIKINILLY